MGTTVSASLFQDLLRIRLVIILVFYSKPANWIRKDNIERNPSSVIPQAIRWPKYRWQVTYGKTRAGIGQILRKLWAWKSVKIVEAETRPNQTHLLALTLSLRSFFRDCSWFLFFTGSLIIGILRISLRADRLFMRWLYVDSFLEYQQIL